MSDGKKESYSRMHLPSFEAPNWMPDGKEVVIQSRKVPFIKYPLQVEALEKLNTDFANRNNNDHGISFNGKMLAISHHRDGLPGGGSTYLRTSFRKEVHRCK